jgi:hypothetical protein
VTVAAAGVDRTVGSAGGSTDGVTGETGATCGVTGVAGVLAIGGSNEPVELLGAEGRNGGGGAAGGGEGVGVEGGVTARCGVPSGCSGDIVDCEVGCKPASSDDISRYLPVPLQLGQRIGGTRFSITWSQAEQRNVGTGRPITQMA